ncbi:MAG: hypothetical protein JXA78_16635 [Anaerolineales bacterium]|nr:hypothetical protein [Anaerolineales bacterium]
MPERAPAGISVQVGDSFLPQSVSEEMHLSEAADGVDIDAVDVTHQIVSAPMDASQVMRIMGGSYPASFLAASGGDNDEGIHSVRQTSDGGYIAAGKTESYGAGSSDAVLIKYDHAGRLTWARTAGGDSLDRAYSVEQTSDGGYIVTGITTSCCFGGSDIFLLKYEGDGTLSWAKISGGSDNDRANSVKQTSDGGYIVAGDTDSYGADGFNVLLIKYAADGTRSWARTAGGGGDDHANEVKQTIDGGFIVAGETSSWGAGDKDVLLLKYAEGGAFSWAKTAGGTSLDRALSVEQAMDGGYIVAGCTWSFGAGNADVLLLKFAGDGALNWTRTTGGSNLDSAHSVGKTLDGGFILAGHTWSYSAGDDEVLLLKVAGDGTLSWAMTAGGSGDDRANTVEQTTGGGYIIAGYTTSFGAGSNDMLLMKTNASGEIPGCEACALVSPVTAVQSPGVTTPSMVISFLLIPTTSQIPVSSSPSPGNVFVCGGYFLAAAGGDDCDWATSVAQTLDGGFIVAGSTVSYGAGERDILLLKYAGDGAFSWARTVGGSGYDYAYSVAQTTDGGYVVAGLTFSYGYGGSDSLLLKYQANGTLSWANVAGSDQLDQATSVAQTADGGYIVAGITDGFGDGKLDVLLIKYQASGFLDWAITAGGSENDRAKSVACTADGGYIVAGTTFSYGATPGNAFLIKVTETSGISWARTAGGDFYDEAVSVAQTADGGYIVAGLTWSFGAGGEDVLLLKYTGDGTLSWARTAGGSGNDEAASVAQTTDGGYAVVGSTSSFSAGYSDFLLLKVAGDGTLSWARSVGGSYDEWAYSLEQTTGGGFLVAGYTWSFGSGCSDMLVMKTNANGEIPGCDACRTAFPSTSSPEPGVSSPSVTRIYYMGFPSISPPLSTASPAPEITFICDFWTEYILKYTFLPLVVR